MALIRLSDYGDIEDGLCAALEGVANDVSVVVSDDPDDFFVASPCQLGNEIIQNGSVNTNPDYLIPVIDPDTNCLTWQTKPDDPTYGSEMLNPWGDGALGEVTINSGSAGVLETNWRSVADLEVPMFTVDVKLLVHWTALWNASGASDYCRWYPHFGEQVVYPAVGNAVGFADARLGHMNPGPWAQGAYSMTLDLPAGTTGKYLAVMFLGSVGVAHGRVAAFAFKA